MKKVRTNSQKIIDTLTFPLRAFTLIEDDKFHMSALRTERFDYVMRYVKGYTLDVGCGRENYFMTKCLEGNGIGIDVFKYEGLTDENIVSDMTKLPYKDNTFDTVTYIANINHVPKSMRQAQMNEALRVLKPGGNILITMGNPIAETVMHKVVYLYDKILGTNVDMDTERGMDEEESYYVKDQEIKDLLANAKFQNIKKVYFGTQWRLNHLFEGIKKDE